MNELGMPLEAGYLIVLKGTSVPQDERSHRTLEENDSLAIAGALDGGLGRRVWGGSPSQWNGEVSSGMW